MAVGAGMIVLALVIGVWVFIASQNKQAAHESQAPNFQAILPESTSIDTLGGWNRFAPPNSDPFYVFTDTIDGVAINVSQQPLPAAFKENTDTKVAELAKGYNATKTITVDDIQVYIGTSARGPQSVIFTKNELLVLIKSQDTIEVDLWKQYIEALG